MPATALGAAEAEPAEAEGEPTKGSSSILVLLLLLLLLFGEYLLQRPSLGVPAAVVLVRELLSALSVSGSCQAENEPRAGRP